MYLGGRHAQPFGLTGEVSADLVGAQVSLGVEVADAGGGERPTVRGGHQEFLQHREAGCPTPARIVGPRTVEPAQQGRDVLAARSGQCVVNLHVGIHPGNQSAEHLQQRRAAIGQRGIALLGSEHERGLAHR